MKRTLASGVVLAMAVAAGGAAPLAQQSSAASAPVEAPNATKPAASAPAGGDQKDGSPMPPQGFTYKAEGRRDPAVDHVLREADDEKQEADHREEVGQVIGQQAEVTSPVSLPPDEGSIHSCSSQVQDVLR